MSFMRQCASFHASCAPAAVSTVLGQLGRLPRPCSRQLCAQPRAAKGRDNKLSWVDPEHRKDVAQILDLAERAATRWEPSFSVFVSPPVVADSMSVLSNVSDVVTIPWGGYPQAERCRWDAMRSCSLISTPAPAALCCYAPATGATHAHDSAAYDIMHISRNTLVPTYFPKLLHNQWVTILRYAPAEQH